MKVEIIPPSLSDEISLKKILEEIQELLDKKINSINVKHKVILNSEKGPMVIRNNNIEIYLNQDKDTEYLWAQNIFQYSHEYCHVKTNFRGYYNKFQWLDEVYCHMASHYVLDNLYHKWQKEPPFNNFKDYAINLKKYSDEHIRKHKNKTIDYIKIKKEITKNKYTYDSEQRTFFEQKSYKILDLFIDNEEYWKTLSYWNTWEYNNIDDEEQVFIKWINLLPDNLKYYGLNIKNKLL